MKITSFKTHTGEIVTGKRLESAIRAVAADWRNLAYNIRESECYASHVTEKEKDEILKNHLKCADDLEQGICVPSFTFSQMINEKLTSHCVALLK